QAVVDVDHAVGLGRLLVDHHERPTRLHQRDAAVVEAAGGAHGHGQAGEGIDAVALRRRRRGDVGDMAEELVTVDVDVAEVGEGVDGPAFEGDGRVVVRPRAAPVEVGLDDGRAGGNAGQRPVAAGGDRAGVGVRGTQGAAGGDVVDVAGEAAARGGVVEE